MFVYKCNRVKIKVTGERSRKFLFSQRKLRSPITHNCGSRKDRAIRFAYLHTDMQFSG